ncbi:hypothetical protein [Nonomuraea sp. JJY05]|uniref:hypothetical protein n=1 Tax=Nonomuraea sp. JJY05 TaxID=3350255 RepID=UPI00373F1747
MAASVSVPTAATASASASKTKNITYRGMTLTVPSNWQKLKVNAQTHGNDWITVTTGPCEAANSDCPSFELVSGKVLTGGQGLEPYRADRPFAPDGLPAPCRFESKYSEKFPGDKPAVSAQRQVGRGHEAQYREWTGECYAQKTDKRTRTFIQREWYLPKEGLLIVDGWNTRGLRDIIKRATWR